MTKTLGVGIIGCGNISGAYLRLAPLFRGIEIRACADIDAQAAERRAAEYSIRAESVEALLAAGDIDIVLNLTIPAAHYEVLRNALKAGKHVFSEKPFVLSLSEGKNLARLAARGNLRVGSAPDTFLGGAHQRARHLVDDGAIGRVIGGAAFVMNHGMEDWHPNPAFFFKQGAGPILDLGPYYVTNLIQLVGPVKRVMAMSSIPSPTRTIASRPRRGENIEVETPTTVFGLLEFANGAIVTLGASWDVWSHGHSNMELYGERGTLKIPDPNFFGGELRMTSSDKPVAKLPDFAHPFSVANEQHERGPMANYRAAGLADMAQAIAEGRPHRCSLELALHAIDVMTGLLKSGATGKPVVMTTTCDRPEPLGIREAEALLSNVDAAKTVAASEGRKAS